LIIKFDIEIDTRDWMVIYYHRLLRHGSIGQDRHRVRQGPEELRRKMADLGIVPSDVIRKAIEGAVREREREQLLKRAESVGGIIRKVRREDWVRAIREDRDAR
jgi:hypothetical protein